MRSLIISYVLILFLFTSCKKKEAIDTATVNVLLILTDSLYEDLTQVYTDNLNGLYKLTEDSLFTDSISNAITIPDSIGFYEFLENSINEINETYHQAQSEIFFTQDQLRSLKEEAKGNRIAEQIFMEHLDQEREIVLLLEERIDTNILFIQTKYNLFFRLNDTIQ